jgi:hypothetical protein
MKIRKEFLIFTVFLLLISGCSQKRYKGFPVYEQNFEIATGETITASVTDLVAVPAENRMFKVERADIVIGSSEKTPDKPELIWFFVVNLKEGSSFEKAVIEKVGPEKEIETLVEDIKPQINSGLWMGRTSTQALSQNENQWLYTKRPSVFIFRLTFTGKGFDKSVLYQPVLISVKSKERYLRVIDKIKKSDS